MSRKSATELLRAKTERIEKVQNRKNHRLRASRDALRRFLDAVERNDWDEARRFYNFYLRRKGQAAKMEEYLWELSRERVALARRAAHEGHSDARDTKPRMTETA